MTENAFRNQLTRAMLWHFGKRVYIQKNHGSAFSSGLVDIEILLNGAVRWVELKAEDSSCSVSPRTLSALQCNTLRRLADAGGNAFVLCLHKRDDIVARWRLVGPGLSKHLGPELMWMRSAKRSEMLKERKTLCEMLDFPDAE